MRGNDQKKGREGRKEGRGGGAYERIMKHNIKNNLNMHYILEINIIKETLASIDLN